MMNLSVEVDILREEYVVIIMLFKTNEIELLEHFQFKPEKAFSISLNTGA